jgi:hypothetical protein
MYKRLLVCAVMLALGVGLAFAQDAKKAPDTGKEREELEVLRQTTIKLIELMVQSGLLTQEKAEDLLREAKRSAAQAMAPKAEQQEKVIRVPYVPQIVRDEIKAEIREEVVAQSKKERWGEPGALPEWMNRFKFDGDITLRYQRNQFDQQNFQNFYLDTQAINNGTASSPYLNTSENSDLYRFQLRLGVQADVTDGVTAGIRLTTGSNANPVSAMQTLGNTMNRSNFALDRAYLKLDPYKWLTVTGGRIANPFLYTDLVWDDDLNFEGLAVKMKPQFAPTRNGFLTLGAFPLEKQDCSNAGQIPDCNRNKWLYAAQAGYEQSLAGNGSVKLGVAVYDFQRIAGVLNDPTFTTSSRASIPKFVQKGNTLFNVVTNGGASLYGLASDFRELNVTAAVDLANFDPVHIMVTGDYVQNIGYDAQKIRDRTQGTLPIVSGQVGTEYTPRTKGYQARLAVGAPSMLKRGDWQVAGAYKYLQRDAVVDGLTDADFHLGGTDAKGWILSGSYAIAKNTWLRLRWLTANEIDGPPLSVDVLQFDLNARF